MLKKTACLIGNSSAGIKECSFLGTPVVNVGTRQQGRTRGINVVDTSHDQNEIVSAIKKQLEHGQYKSDILYYKPNTSNQIVTLLTSVDLYTQKHFTG